MGVVSAVPGVLIKEEDYRNSQDRVCLQNQVLVFPPKGLLARARSQLEEKKSNSIKHVVHFGH